MPRNTRRAFGVLRLQFWAGRIWNTKSDLVVMDDFLSHIAERSRQIELGILHSMLLEQFGSLVQSYRNRTWLGSAVQLPLGLGLEKLPASVGSTRVVHGCFA